MACLLELYGLEDMAAELILEFPGAFGGQANRMLDHLAHRLDRNRASYAELIGHFCGSVGQYRT